MKLWYSYEIKTQIQKNSKETKKPIQETTGRHGSTIKEKQTKAIFQTFKQTKYITFKSLAYTVFRTFPEPCARFLDCLYFYSKLYGHWLSRIWLFRQGNYNKGNRSL